MSIEIAQKIYKKLQAKKQTLALAESCTGGRMAAALTAVPGVSEIFLGSLVTYSDLLKEKCLNVPLITLQQYGAVSVQTAEAMVKGLFQITGAGYGIAVTGIAGPSGGTSKLPVGTIIYAFGPQNGQIKSGILHYSGSREKILEQASKDIFISFLNYI
jgi:PncC family amidohydrolase